jgi:hypothetical protein
MIRKDSVNRHGPAGYRRTRIGYVATPEDNRAIRIAGLICSL